MQPCEALLHLHTRSTKTNMLENTKINIKLKLSSLWTSLMFLYIYGDYFELYAPNKIEKLLNITDVLDTPVKLFLASVLLAIPAIMISLNFFASPTLSKFLNIFFGVLFTLVVIIVASTSLYTWYSFYVFYAILEAIISGLIVWYAWNWPKTYD